MEKYQFELTMSDLAKNINIKKGLMQMNQQELVHSLREFTEMKAKVRSLRTPEEQETVEYFSKHINWLRKEYTSQMNELRSMKRQFKARQALASGNEYMFHMLMTLA